MKTALPKLVYILGLASFMGDVASEMVYPLLPLFLSSVLGATPVAMGLIEGLAEATASVAKIFSGRRTDQTQKRKSLVTIGYAIATAMRPVMAFSTSCIHVLGARFTDRLGKGIRAAPRDALLSDVTPHERRGEAYGIHQGMDHAGAVVGPVVATFLISQLEWSLRKVFLFATIPSAVALAIIFFWVDEKKVVKKSTDSKPIEVSTLGHDFKRLGSSFHAFLVALFLFTLGNSTDAFLLLKLSEVGVPIAMIPILWALQNGIKMTANYIGGIVSDSWSRRGMIWMGWGVYALVYFGFSQLNQKGEVIALFLLYGLYFGFVEPAEKALVADLVPSRFVGSAFGIFHFVVGIGALPASVLFGWVWHRYGSSNAFLMGAVLSGLASVLLFFIRRQPRHA